MGDLSNDFSEWEFACRCTCSICNVSTAFINRLQATRTVAGIAFNINSGCRCPSHNNKERGKPTSDHLTTEKIQCEGADIMCENSFDRYIIIRAAVLCGFKRIFIHKSFIHLGMKKENPQEILGLY